MVNGIKLIILFILIWHVESRFQRGDLTHSNYPSGPIDTHKLNRIEFYTASIHTVQLDLGTSKDPNKNSKFDFLVDTGSFWMWVNTCDFQLANGEYTQALNTTLECNRDYFDIDNSASAYCTDQYITIEYLDGEQYQGRQCNDMVGILDGAVSKVFAPFLTIVDEQQQQKLAQDMRPMGEEEKEDT